MIYAIRVYGHGKREIYKIGYAKNLERRLDQYFYHYPFVELITTREGDTKLESLLHRALYSMGGLKFQKNGKIDEEYTKLVTSPAFINVISKSMSDLAMKKFVEENINGKNVSFEVTINSVDENKNPITGEICPLQYKAKGSVQVIKDFSIGGIVITEGFSIFIYSNNDALLSVKIGSPYTVNGTAKLEQLGAGLGKLWIYTVNEE